MLVRCAAPVDAVLWAVREKLGPEVEVSELSRAEPLDFDTLGASLTGTAVPFNTDASWLRLLGAPVSLMGPGDMRTAHGPDEELAVAELATGIARYAEALFRLS